MENEDSDTAIKEVLQGITIPPQPQILVDIHMEQAMPGPSFNRITELICQDPGLAGTVLKVVNSSFYGLKTHITSIKKATEILGIKQITNIVNGLSVKGQLSDEEVLVLGNFWDSAMEIALCCATIAKAVGFESPDVAYSVGLLHNCGTALMLKRFPNYSEVITKAYANLEHHQERVIDIENRELKTNHAVLGYFIAKSWNLPREICQVIAEHHNMKEIFIDSSKEGINYDPTKKTLMSILKIAEHLVGNYKILGKQAIDHEWEYISEQLLEYIGMTADDYDALKDQIASLGIGNSETAFFEN